MFGGSVLVKRLDGKKNCLQDQILKDTANFLPRFKKVVRLDKEKFYHLENVQLKKGFPDFVDIHILIKSI